ncbi:kelch motif domain-containing protein [Rhizoctonia solani AG-1 IA]|uniref:Kelch motif domain-containing protein n=1 Tax=Thanatephorus cucumeris (strain AG1-IA) TaxID=983506 RepID=L8WL82_THACA|nr:kelch motif domain-containing protein [Rhizoctonia solani AG-1 IA]
MSTSCSGSPWSAHNLQIDTPAYKRPSSNCANKKGAKVSSPPLPRHYHSSSIKADSAGDIFVFGGRIEYQLKNDTWAIRLSRNSDIRLKPKESSTSLRATARLLDATGKVPSPRWGHASALAGKRLIVWGGNTSLGREFKDTSQASTVTHVWANLDVQPAPYARSRHPVAQGIPKWERIEVAQGSRSPPKRGGHGMVSYENKLYMFGGNDDFGKFGDTWCFDMATRVWTELKPASPTPSRRSQHALSLVGDEVYMFGGHGDNGRLGDTWSFGMNQTWRILSDTKSQPSPREKHTVASVGDLMVIFGGRGDDWDQTGKMTLVHVLDTKLVRIDPLNNKEAAVGHPPILNTGQLYSRSTKDLPTGEEIQRPERPISAAFSKDTNSPSFHKHGIDGSMSSELGVKYSKTYQNSYPAEPLTMGIHSEQFHTHDGRNIGKITCDTITGAMPAVEIMRYLIEHGCHNIADELDISHVSEYPVSNGGFGDVYRATLRDGSRVAVKCIRVIVDSTSRGKSFLKHAAHELYVWSKCRHSNVLELYGVTLFRGQIAMVSPWLEEGHIRWYLLRNPNANRCSLVHGDLKPVSYLVVKGGAGLNSVWVVVYRRTYWYLRITRQSLRILGTQPANSVQAPELFELGTKPSLESDVYSLGMEVIGRIIPWEGAQDLAVMRNVITGKHPARPETRIPSGITQADCLWKVLTSCWAYSPKDRPKAWVVKEEVSDGGLALTHSLSFIQIAGIMLDGSLGIID